MTVYDIAIIGGGINGAAIAADAAGRGLRVFLCEKGDIASGTSSASSKLIHGGLRYLEFFDVKLVRESLQERGILLRRAPHLVHPLSFIMPDNKECHSPWLIRLGLWFYDFLASDTKLPKSKRINLSQLPASSHLKRQSKGFSYSDCWGDDARLVIANLQLAKQKGAVITPRNEFLSAQHEGSHWLLQLSESESIHAKIIVNATGPWVDQVNQRFSVKKNYQPVLTLVKGSHIIIKRFYEGKHAFILQNHDGRVVFLIPYGEDELIIGTTDVLYEESLENIKITAEEIGYLKKAVMNYFDIEIKAENIIASYSGVRPLYNDHAAKKASKITRDYFIALESFDHLPLVTVYGGKLTTHRRLAEQVLQKLKKYFPAMALSSTKNLPLPGGDIPNYQQFFACCQQNFGWLPIDLLKRLARNYGTHIYQLLANCKSIEDLGQYIGGALYEREVRYLIENEWAKTPDDILWRRTKQGLYFTVEEVDKLSLFMESL